MSKFHVYESHIGEVYILDHYDSDLLSYCPLCGDHDNYIGEFDNIEELASWMLVNHYSEDYIKEVQKNAEGKVNGSKVKWNYVHLKKADNEEKEFFECDMIWDGLIPEEDEEVLVSDGKTVWTDIWVYYNANDCGFESTELEKFYWISFPKPPKKEVEHD